ncbi:uncharacterized protein LOC117194860 [Drosophila miranda]|uniref:uncharacterized protein LOC117194860 n=1 Tax=Drosophila miranda TaxID=7229 RepID=UPI00143F1406|nr:uncharacterized protein LOC117194860 [Drosophila miranda]
MGDSDGFNAVPQMASKGPPPVLSSFWTGGASPDSRGDYSDDPHEEYSDCRYEGDYEGDYSMPTEEDQEEESCSCQSQTCQPERVQLDRAHRVGLGVGGALRRPFPQGLPAGVPRRSRALHNAAGAPSAHGGLVPPRLGDRCGQGRAAGAATAVLRGFLAGR